MQKRGMINIWVQSAEQLVVDNNQMSVAIKSQSPSQSGV